MKECSHCHKEIKSEARFCNHCGEQVESGQPEAHKQEDNVETPPIIPQTSEEIKDTKADQKPGADDQTSPEQTGQTGSEEEATEQAGTEASTTSPPTPEKPKQKEKKSKKKIWSIAIIAVIILLGAGVYILGDKLTSERHAIESFQDALKEGDVKELKGMLSSNDKDLKITDKGIEGLIALYEADENGFKEQVEKLKVTKSDKASETSTEPITLEKSGKQWLIYDDYTFVVQPIYFEVHTNFPDTALSVNGEEAVTADSDNFSEVVGPYMPGEYEWHAVQAFGSQDIEVEKTIVNTDPSIREEVDLNFEAETVQLDLASSDYDMLDEIILYINDEKTDVNVLEEDTVGPLLTDGSMTLAFEAEFPWGTMKTEDVTVEGSNMNVNFAGNSDLQEAIGEVIKQYNVQVTEIYTQLTLDNIGSMPEQYALDYLENVLPNLMQGYEYSAVFHGVDLDLDSLQLYYQDADDVSFWFVEVNGISHMEEASYLIDEEPELEEIDQEMAYAVGYDTDGEQWLVMGSDVATGVNEDNLLDFYVNDPEQFDSIWNEGLEDSDLGELGDEFDDFIKELEKEEKKNKDKDKDKKKDKKQKKDKDKKKDK